MKGDAATTRIGNEKAKREGPEERVNEGNVLCLQGLREDFGLTNVN